MGIGYGLTALATGLSQGAGAAIEGQRAGEQSAFQRFVQQRAQQREEEQFGWQREAHTQSVTDGLRKRQLERIDLGNRGITEAPDGTLAQDPTQTPEAKAAARNRATYDALKAQYPELGTYAPGVDYGKEFGHVLTNRTTLSGQQITLRGQDLSHQDRQASNAVARGTLSVAQARERREAAAAQRAASGGGKPTEQQQRFSMIAPQLAQADSTIQALQQQPPSLAETVASHIPLVGNLFTSERQQRLDQAGDTFAQHYLYGLSGASAPDKEVERVSSSIRRRQGDGDGTVAQKNATRALMVSGAQGVAARPRSIAEARERTAAPHASAADPAARWEQLVAGGMAKDAATAQVRRELGGGR